MSVQPDNAQSTRPFFLRDESIRGLGAMAVMAYHASGVHLHGHALLPHAAWADSTMVPGALRWLGTMLVPGHAALLTFFVISGFVLRLSLEHGPQRVGAMSGKFLVGRLFRFYPIMIVGTLVMMAVILAGLHKATIDGAAVPLTPWRVIANCLLLEVSMNGTLWAIQLELVMVPIILLLYLLERRAGPRAVLIVAIVTAVAALTGNWARYTPLSRHLFAFALGMIVPTLGRQMVQRLSLRQANLCIFVCALVLLTTGPALGLYSRYTTVIEGLAAFPMVALIAYRQDLRAFNVLDARPLRILGASSGSYYILHMAALVLLLAWMPHVVPAHWSNAAPLLTGALVVLVCILALVPVAIIAYFGVEVPGIKLGRIANRKLGLDKREPKVDLAAAAP